VRSPAKKAMPKTGKPAGKQEKEVNSKLWLVTSWQSADCNQQATTEISKQQKV